MSDDDYPSPEERKTLDRLQRQARREGRRNRHNHGALTGASTALPTVTADVAAAAPRRKPHPGRRRLLVRLGIAVAVLFLVMVAFPPFLVPADGTVTSRFFLRTEPESIFLFDVEHHSGIDFGAPAGTRVRAARSGRVVRVAESATYGLVVDLRHPLGIVTRYAHMSEQSVREGAWVWRRGKIGEVGMTGRATGPHLHFEIRLGERSLPPGVFLMFDQLRRTLF